MLEKQSENLWTYKSHWHLPIIGIDVGRRMTIVRLSWGGLFIHSPLELTSDIERILKELGTVQYVVAPNSFHHLFAKAYLERFPQAQFWTIPDVVRKRPELEKPKLLTEAGSAFIGEEIYLEIVQGRRWFCEAVFLHKPSKTLITTDLMFNVPRQSNLLKRLAAKILKLDPPAKPSRLERFLLGGTSDAKVAIHKISHFDFERIIVAHGDIITKDAKQLFNEGFRFLLNES